MARNLWAPDHLGLMFQVSVQGTNGPLLNYSYMHNSRSVHTSLLGVKTPCVFIKKWHSYWACVVNKVTFPLCMDTFGTPCRQSLTPCMIFVVVVCLCFLLNKKPGISRFDCLDLTLCSLICFEGKAVKPSRRPIHRCLPSRSAWLI